MKKTLYIHIGSGKTGTTSIQYMLHENARSLLENGFLYQTTKDLREPNHHDYVSLPFDSGMWQRDKNKYIRLKQSFLESEAKNLIISTELVLGAPVHYLEAIKHLFSEFEIKIVVYVRNQLSSLPSHFLQKQKDLSFDYKENINGFFEAYKTIWGNEPQIILNTWMKVFGKDNILARVYDKNILIDCDICSDFLKVLDIDIPISNTSYQSNISLVPEVSHLITVIDSQMPSLREHLNIVMFKFRQEVVIKKLLEASVKIIHKDMDAVDILLNMLLQEIRNKFSKLDSNKLNEIKYAIEQLKNILHGSEKQNFMNEELKSKIRNYYEKSNLEFAKTFLNEYEANIFLKNILKEAL